MRVFLPAVTICLLTSCALPQHDPNLLGLLTVDGPEGYLNGRPVSGQRIPIHNNDHVSTGSATGMRIQMQHYGNTYIQLDENTDPDLIQEADCLWIRMLHGKLFAEGTSLCLESPNLAAALHSQVDLMVQPTKGGAGATRSALTVLHGRAELTKPELRLVPAGYEQVVASGREVEPVRLLSNDELRDVVAWRFSHPLLLQPVPPPRATPVYVAPAKPAPVSVPDPTLPPPPAISKSSKYNTVPSIWCCLPNGAVQQETTLICQRSQGKAYSDERTARASCPVIVK